MESREYIEPSIASEIIRKAILDNEDINHEMTSTKALLEEMMDKYTLSNNKLNELIAILIRSRFIYRFEDYLVSPERWFKIQKAKELDYLHGKAKAA